MQLMYTILLGVLMVFIIYLLYKNFNSNKAHIGSIKSGTESDVISASSLPSSNASSNYAYSIWFNVNNWQYRFSESKTLLSRASNNLGNINNPLITFSPYENDININITTYPSSGGDETDTTTMPVINPACTIKNFPLQKWTNLIVSLNGRTSDIYLDGKLVRTCVLPGVPKIDPNADINITPDGGFSGWTTNIEYWGNALNPQEAYNIYKKGYGGSFGFFNNLLNKYKLKVSYLVNNKEEGSFEV